MVVGVIFGALIFVQLSEIVWYYCFGMEISSGLEVAERFGSLPSGRQPNVLRC